VKIVWTPIQFYGDTLFQCRIDDEQAGFAEATSRSKPRALAFALEELAKRYHAEANTEVKP
jgi:hypothetical protein